MKVDYPLLISDLAATPVSFDFSPIRLLEVEISRSLPNISSCIDTGQCYSSAIVLVRLHNHPLGLVQLKLGQNGLHAREYANSIWDALSIQINNHRRDDGLLPVTRLYEEGLFDEAHPKCQEDRKRLEANAPFISVIVPTRDRPAIVNCLRSLVSLNYPRYEIIIVDNAPSTNKTAELVRQYCSAFPNLHYVRENRPGIDWARNCGILLAQGEIIAFTDDDVVIDPDWLTGIAKGFSQGNNIACVTGLVLPLELETPAQILFENYYGFSRGFSTRIFDVDKNRASDPLFPYRPSEFGTGANMAFRASFLREIGGFDPGLGSGTPCTGDDSYAFFQVINQGYQLVYEPNALVLHLHRREIDALYRQIRGFGTGITGFLTKCFLNNPKCLIDLCSKLPYGLFLTLSSKTRRNQNRKTDFPNELRRAELEGMFIGPFAYLQSRYLLFKLMKQYSLDE